MEKYNGALIDTRPQTEKEKDWKHEELFGFAAVPLQWVEKTNWKQYTIRNQDGSGACGPFAMAIALGRNEEKENGSYINLDPAYIYNKRSNRPAPGMNMINMFELACSIGMPGDVALASDGKNDEELAARTFSNEQVQYALKHKGLNYVFIRKDIDAIAELIAKGITPIFIVRCQIEEWTTTPTVLFPEKTKDFNINHFNPFIDFGLINGKKVLVHQDSWGSSYGANGLRFMDQAFLDKRVETVGYVVDLPNEKPVEKPHYFFKKNLSYGIMNSIEVSHLQDILKYEGCLNEKIPSTGNFLDLTRLAVMKLQRKYSIASESDIIKANGNFGPLTRAKINSIYGV